MVSKKINISGNNLIILNENQIRNALNSMFFEANNQYLKSPNDINEYDIQSGFSNHLRDQLKNKGVTIKKERNKYDISVQKRDKNKLSLNYRIEIKSFLKKSESLSLKKIHEDFGKLRSFLSKSNTTITKSYLFIAVTQKKLNSARGGNKLFSEFCLHNHHRSELEKFIGIGFKVYRSYFIGAGNNGNNEPIANQIRFFLFELK